MSTVASSDKLWLFRPLFADGKDLSEKGIRKQYLELDPKPSALKTASPSIFAGAGAFVLGVLGFLFGKDSPLLKYLGLILGVAGAGLALAGQFIFKVDLSNLTDSNETNSNKTNEPKPLSIQKNELDDLTNPILKQYKTGTLTLENIISSFDKLINNDTSNTMIGIALHALGRINDPKAKQKIIDFLLSPGDLFLDSYKVRGALALINKVRDHNEVGVYKLLVDFVKDKKHSAPLRESIISVLIDNYSKEDCLAILNEIKHDDQIHSFIGEKISEYHK